jgi:hypothetical protein
VNRTGQYGGNKVPLPGKRQTAFEKRVLRPTFEPKRNEVTYDWRKPHYKEFGETLKYQPGDEIKKLMGVACSTYWGEEVYRGFWWGNMTEREHLPELGIDWRITKRV